MWLVFDLVSKSVSKVDSFLCQNAANLGAPTLTVLQARQGGATTSHSLLTKKSPFGSVAEHSLGKGEVPGPIPGMGTSFDFSCSDLLDF